MLILWAWMVTLWRGTRCAPVCPAVPAVRMFLGHRTQPVTAIRWLASYLYALSRVPKPPVLT